MFLGLAIFTGIISLIAWVIVHFQNKHLKDLADTPTLNCTQLSSMSGPVKCEVVGEVQAPSNQPLSAPYSNTSCVWYRTRVVQHYWERYRDSEGREDWRKEQKIVESFESQAPFYLNDGTGWILVEPQGAQINEAEHTFDGFEQGPPQGLLGSIFSTERTDGYQRQEWVVRPGTRIFASGEIRNPQNQPALSKGKAGLFISLKSEEEVVKEAQGTQKVARLVGMITGSAALVLAVLTLVSG